MSKPFESYVGGKEGTGVFQTIINQIPPHEIYAELFLGNGTIFRKKKRATYTILSDLSINVIEQWQTMGVKLIDKFDVFECFMHPKSALLIQKSALEILMQKNTTGFPSLGDSNYELDHPDTFIYLDPPYPFSVRKDQRPAYEHEMSDEHHNDLLGVVTRFKNAKIMLSSYPNEMYDNALPTWRKLDFKGQTRRGKVTERIYMNYPEPEELHDYQYLGKNFRERWRIEKSVRNIVNKFKRLPPLQRNAVLNAVISELEVKSSMNA